MEKGCNPFHPYTWHKVCIESLNLLRDIIQIVCQINYTYSLTVDSTPMGIFTAKVMSHFEIYNCYEENTSIWASKYDEFLELHNDEFLLHNSLMSMSFRTK